MGRRRLGAHPAGELRAHRPDQRYARFASGDAGYVSVVPETAGADDADRLVGEIRSQKVPFKALVGGAAATNNTAPAPRQRPGSHRLTGPRRMAAHGSTARHPGRRTRRRRAARHGPPPAGRPHASPLTRAV
ncbi:hypothetical protein JK364_26555 [Streptomyces sp. 110]|uniref:Uncharacterized protein n=1 Tax=Streptomyces endocoffeicus TaxID=2898945 RepID=A0ABS1PU40_9ACTN|nr:hypothetical protein [Streptomyces endocoffeicus]MBL1115938.1 hypothetical protein [Streptomyces endocoffeicus]